MRPTLSTVLIFIIIFSGCATAEISESRHAYILANDHGWIEIEVRHQGIESISESEEIAVMPLCGFVVYLNNEPFFTESVMPFGQEPPYQTDTGFRVPVPVGQFELKLRYSGCSGFAIVVDSEGKEVKEAIELELRYQVEVKDNMVTEIYFDGKELSLKGFTPDYKVTLEDINEKLIRLERKLSE